MNTISDDSSVSDSGEDSVTENQLVETVNEMVIKFKRERLKLDLGSMNTLKSWWNQMEHHIFIASMNSKMEENVVIK
jgi:hypothetical protein